MSNLFHIGYNFLTYGTFMSNLFHIGYNAVNNRVLIECALDHLNYRNLTDIIKNL